MVRTILLYGCETWTLKVQHERALAAFEHGFLRQILRIRRQDCTSNSNMRQLCNIKRDMSTTLKKCRLEWLNHVLRRPPESMPCRIFLVEPYDSWKRHQGGHKNNCWTLIKFDLHLIGSFKKFGHRGSAQWLLFAEQWAAVRETCSKEVTRILDAG